MDFRKLYEQTKDLSVLLAEDHEPTRLGLEEVLQDLFKEVVSFPNGRDAYYSYLDRYDHTPYDLIITDIQMPHMDGVTLTKKVKEKRPEQQIIVLSAYADKNYLIDLINVGISHFITKPFEYDSFLDTLYRISSKISIDNTKSPHPESTTTVRLGEYTEWDKEKHTLKHEGKSITLSKNELLLMELLIQNGEQITTTTTLIEKFYLEGVDISEGGLRNLVLRIRKKLPENIIGTVYGLGYKVLVAP